MPETISNTHIDRDEELREQLLVNKRRSGGDPSLLLDLLAELLDRKSWRQREGHTGKPWSFLRYVQTPFDDGGLGWDVEDVKNIIRFEHKYEKEGVRHTPAKAAEMEAMRRKVRDLLNPEANKQGRPEKGDNITFREDQKGTSESYTVRRLKRDRPELAEKVIEGEMSANAAAIEAGFRTKTVSVPVRKGGEVQIERAGDTLIKHFGADAKRLAEYILANR